MAHSGAAVILWLAPMLAMKRVHQLQNTIEHLGLPHEDNVLVNTRSTRTNAVMRWLGWQMQYHTAHHAFPGVPFHRLRELNAAIFTSRGAAPPSMTYLGFQIAVLRAFARGRTEADYPDERSWIADPAAWLIDFWSIRRCGRWTGWRRPRRRWPTNSTACALPGSTEWRSTSVLSPWSKRKRPCRISCRTGLAGGLTAFPIVGGGAAPGVAAGTPDRGALCGRDRSGNAGCSCPRCCP